MTNTLILISDRLVLIKEIMDRIVRKVFQASLKDEEFKDMVELADGDRRPSRFMEHNEKVVVASYYYGWLISRYGTEWRQHI